MAVAIVVVVLFLGGLAWTLWGNRETKSVHIVDFDGDQANAPGKDGLHSGVMPIGSAFLDAGRADFNLKLKAKQRLSGMEVTAYKKKNPLFHNRPTSTTVSSGSDGSHYHAPMPEYVLSQRDMVRWDHVQEGERPSILDNLQKQGVSPHDLERWEPQTLRRPEDHPNYPPGAPVYEEIESITDMSEEQAKSEVGRYEAPQVASHIETPAMQGQYVRPSIRVSRCNGQRASLVIQRGPSLDADL